MVENTHVAVYAYVLHPLVHQAIGQVVHVDQALPVIAYQVGVLLPYGPPGVQEDLVYSFMLTFVVGCVVVVVIFGHVSGALYRAAVIVRGEVSERIPIKPVYNGIWRVVLSSGIFWNVIAVIVHPCLPDHSQAIVPCARARRIARG